MINYRRSHLKEFKPMKSHHMRVYPRVGSERIPTRKGVRWSGSGWTRIPTGRSINPGMLDLPVSMVEMSPAWLSSNCQCWLSTCRVMRCMTSAVSTIMMQFYSRKMKLGATWWKQSWIMSFEHLFPLVFKYNVSASLCVLFLVTVPFNDQSHNF